jgi:hypothetical protein
MPQIGSTRSLERVQFFNGERLFASDLQTLEEFHREMRWLHNKSLHQPGVALGLAVAGEKGDRQVTVQPGYAIDSSGREIVLTESGHIEAVPPVADDGAGNPVTFYLTVSYPATLAPSQSQLANCSSEPPGAVRLSELPIFCWVRLQSAASAALLQQIESGQRILVATAQVLNCQLYQPISVANRRNAKPSAQPQIYSARVALPWAPGVIEFRITSFGIELKKLDSKGDIDPKGLVTIDTSAAGFQTRPCYFANLIGDRTLGLAGGQGSMEPLLGISSPAAELARFQLSVVIPRFFLLDTAEIIRDALNARQADPQGRWQIEWLGVEA